MFKLMDKKIITILPKLFLLNWSYGYLKFTRSGALHFMQPEQIFVCILLVLIVLFLSITIAIVSTKIYDKRDNFNFEIVNFPFVDAPFPMVYTFGKFCFARVCSNFDDFNNRNKF